MGNILKESQRKIKTVFPLEGGPPRPLRERVRKYYTGNKMLYVE